MGKPQRITKLQQPWNRTVPVNGRNSVVGSKVIGDYLEEGEDNLTWRVLVFERPEPAAKPQAARRKHRRTQAQEGAALGVTSAEPGKATLGGDSSGS